MAMSASASCDASANVNNEPDCDAESLMLYIGAGWDVEALLYGSSFKCRRYVLVDCIPNRHLYWKPGESGYEISRKEELIVGMIRYKLALLEMPVVSQERIVDDDTGKAMVRWKLQDGEKDAPEYDVCYYFDVKYPDDFSENGACPRELRNALSEATVLFMKGYPPLPFSGIVENCPRLSMLISTDDNLKSIQRDKSGKAALGRFEVQVVKELDLEAIQACTNSFEVVQKCIHMI